MSFRRALFFLASRITFEILLVSQRISSAQYNRSKIDPTTPTAFANMTLPHLKPPDPGLDRIIHQ